MIPLLKLDSLIMKTKPKFRLSLKDCLYLCGFALVCVAWMQMYCHVRELHRAIVKPVFTIHTNTVLPPSLP